MYTKAEYLRVVGNLTLAALLGVQSSGGNLERRVGGAETPYPQFGSATLPIPATTPERDAFYEFMKLQGWEFHTNYNPYIDINLGLNFPWIVITPEGQIFQRFFVPPPSIIKREQPKTLEDVKSEFSRKSPQYEFNVEPKAYERDGKPLENHYSVWKKRRR